MAAGASPLKTLSDNVVPPALTPGKKVVALEAELQKKDAQNEALQSTIADLTSALAGLNMVKEKIDNEAAAVAAAEAPKKSKKDKNAPVPSKTAYKFYCDAHPKPKEGVNMQQVWKECPPEIRQSYEAMAKADKARYQKELAAYNEEKEALELYYNEKKQEMALEFLDAHLNAQAALEKVDAENKKGKKKSKAKKDPEAPKRPLSAYMYFVADKRDSVVQKNPDAKATEVIKTLGEMWGQLEKGKGGKKGTKKYEDMAADDKARYETEKTAYDAMIAGRKEEAEKEKAYQLQKDKEEAMKFMKSRQDAAASVVAASAAPNGKAMANMVAIEDMSVVSELTNANNNNKPLKKKKDPNAPKKAKSAYIYFCTEKRNDIKATMPEGTAQKDLLAEVGRQWKELAEEGKARYNTLAEEDKERYAKEMEKYNAEKK